MKRDCNRCATVSSDCPLNRVPTKMKPTVNRHYECYKWSEPKSMRTPLLIHLMMKDTYQPVAALLHSVGLRLKEKEGYPFFSLYS